MSEFRNFSKLISLKKNFHNSTRILRFYWIRFKILLTCIIKLKIISQNRNFVVKYSFMELIAAEQDRIKIKTLNRQKKLYCDLSHFSFFLHFMSDSLFFLLLMVRFVKFISIFI